jgi:hypothetical protein
MESNKIILSILIPSVPIRLKKLEGMFSFYQTMIDKYNLSGNVEIVSILDNKSRSIGEKRTNLINIANGKYIVMTDDDDSLTESYFKNIESAIKQDKDVITYKQHATINDVWSIVEFRLNNPNEQFNGFAKTLRPAWHCCTWKKKIVEKIQFDYKNWGEDDIFSKKGNILAKSETFIDDILHIYIHNENNTEAFNS